MYITLKSKGRIVLPKKIRDEIGLQDNDFLEVEVKDNKIILTPKVFIDKFETK